MREAPYRVEISPGAWRHIGALPRGAFRRIQEELRCVAEAAGESPEPALEVTEAPTPQQRVIDGLVVTYLIDPGVRTVTLTEVKRRLTSAS